MFGLALPGGRPRLSDGSLSDDSGTASGIRVIDLTVWMSGAIGAMLLGDLGADVIKVEGPTGDPVGSTFRSARPMRPGRRAG